MTTKVTVYAHAGWPVEVTFLDNSNGHEFMQNGKVVVAPYTTQDFYIYDTRMIAIRELPNDASGVAGKAKDIL